MDGKIEFIAHRRPVQSGPVAEINLAQVVENRLLVAVRLECRCECLLDPLHRTGVDGVNRLHAQIFSQNFCLLFAAWRKIHVNPPAENAVITRFNFAVTNQQ